MKLLSLLAVLACTVAAYPQCQMQFGSPAGVAYAPTYGVQQTFAAPVYAPQAFAAPAYAPQVFAAPAYGVQAFAAPVYAPRYNIATGGNVVWASPVTSGYIPRWSIGGSRSFVPGFGIVNRGFVPGFGIGGFNRGFSVGFGFRRF